MKKLILLIAALCGFFIAQNLQAACTNYTTFVDGNVLTAAQLNSLQTNYTNCYADIVDGTNFTGDINLYSGADLNVYSDAGTTLKASIDGATGKIIGAPWKVGAYNINLAPAQTSVASDSIKIQCGNAACSTSNPGFVVMDGTTAGVLAQFAITSDITINLTGAHWGADTTGDLTGRILRVLADDDNGTLRWCVALLGGRDTLLTTNTTATASSVSTPEKVLCNTAVGSSANATLEVGYFRSDFDDTGGSSENLNTIQSGVNDVVTGKSADGLWQPWNPTITGLSLISSNYDVWCQVGEMITINFYILGTSNSTDFAITLPVKSNTVTSGGASFSFALGGTLDNGSFVTPGHGVFLFNDSTALTLQKFDANNWTNSGSKSIGGSFSYKAGPSASFIE